MSQNKYSNKSNDEPTFVPYFANALVEGGKGINENLGNGIGVLLDYALSNAEDERLDNPYFAQNGHDGPSPQSTLYMDRKRKLALGGSVVTGMLDIGGTVSFASGASNSLMWYKLNALFQKLVPPSRRSKKVEYASWYSWQVAKKAVPAGSLEMQMTAIMRTKLYNAGGDITKGAVTFGTGGFTGYYVNSAMQSITPYLVSMFGYDAITLAQGLHWFAFLEQVVGRGQGKGPALRILETLWQEVSIRSRLVPSIAVVAAEPRGWLVVADMIS